MGDGPPVDSFGVVSDVGFLIGGNMRLCIVEVLVVAGVLQSLPFLRLLWCRWRDRWDDINIWFCDLM